MPGDRHITGHLEALRHYWRALIWGTWKPKISAGLSQKQAEQVVEYFEQEIEIALVDLSKAAVLEAWERVQSP